MFHQIADEIIESLRTIELFEDSYGLNDGSDSEDLDYNNYNPQMETFMREIDDYSPDSSSSPETPSSPSSSPLPDNFYRAPNDRFHDNDPYMYYESGEYPTDDDYFGALFLLKTNDALIRSDELYEPLYFEPLHQYLLMKEYNLDYKPPRKMWNSIIGFYTDIKNVLHGVSQEYDRIDDLQDFIDDMGYL